MNTELYHHGVKGMKWGVRRKQNSVGLYKRKKNPIEVPHDDYLKAHDKKKVSQLSDQELKERINRLNMEQQYAKLNPSSIAKGKQRANTALKTLTTVATATGTALTLYNNAEKISKLLKVLAKVG